jgi:hypothetical protein
MTLAERFDEWAKAYEQKGMEKGLEKGELLVLQQQLVKRFGPLPSNLLIRIAAADRAQLELRCDRVLDAATLDVVFIN